ncbi:unnamed protein product [Chrysoparadoxa australica]
MANPCIKRLRKEVQNISKNNDSSIKLTPNDDDIRRWKAELTGPPGTPYEGGVYELVVEVGPQYPMSPPIMKFVTKVFHPNVHFETGEICLDILKKEWSPAWSIQASCRAIISLLADPAADSPLNCDAGNMIRANDMRAFNSMARMYTLDFATGSK